MASSSANDDVSIDKRDDIEGSRIEYYGSSATFCGYCGTEGDNTSTRRSYDMRAFSLEPEDYQSLSDRGWRRSGNYCYHPLNYATCCPNYAIICRALEFKLSKSQRKIIQNVNNYLVNGSISEKCQLNYRRACEKTAYPLNDITKDEFAKLKSSSKSKHRRFVAACLKVSEKQKIDLNEAIRVVRTRARNKMNAMHNVGQLEDYLFPRKHNLADNQSTLKPKHKLTIRMRHVESKSCISMRNEEHELMRKYQKDIHREDENNWDMTRYCNFLIDTPLITRPLIDFKHSSYNSDDNDNHSTTDPTIDESDFLILKPPELPTAYGTYHCYYHLDGKLMAVGVLDLLPEYLTTVYFFYEPKYKFLNLGTYSALHEISMVRQMNKYFKSSTGKPNRLINYQLGFYVHECKKMHYKTKFRPCYLLCSETCDYVPLDICLKKLEGRKYARFSIDPAKDGFSIYTNDDLEFSEIFKIPMISPPLGKSTCMKYVMWLRYNFGTEYGQLLIEGCLIPYFKLVGEALLHRLTLQVDCMHSAFLKRYKRKNPSHPDGAIQKDDGSDSD